MPTIKIYTWHFLSHSHFQRTLKLQTFKHTHTRTHIPWYVLRLYVNSIELYSAIWQINSWKLNQSEWIFLKAKRLCCVFLLVNRKLLSILLSAVHIHFHTVSVYAHHTVVHSSQPFHLFPLIIILYWCWCQFCRNFITHLIDTQALRPLVFLYVSRYKSQLNFNCQLYRFVFVTPRLPFGFELLFFFFASRQLLYKSCWLKSHVPDELIVDIDRNLSLLRQN